MDRGPYGGPPGSVEAFQDIEGMLEVLGPVMMFSGTNRASRMASSCGADLLKDGKGACLGVMAGGIGADCGERRVGCW
jgi:hypothetical protein